MAATKKGFILDDKSLEPVYKVPRQGTRKPPTTPRNSTRTTKKK